MVSRVFKEHRKLLGIAMIILGAILMVFSHYIAQKVEEGRGRIARGQSQVDTVKSVFSTNRYSKPIGDKLMEPAQKKIDAGTVQADEYESLAKTLQIVGIVLAAGGIGILVFWRK